MTDELKWYIESIIHECELLENGRFTGSHTFQFNWKEGKIGNLNIGLSKSIRKITRPEE